MKTLFIDPLHWTASAVGTKARFSLLVIVLSALTGYAFLQVANRGLQSGAALAVFVIWMQFCLLYAMRALYLRVAGPSAAKPEAV